MNISDCPQTSVTTFRDTYTLDGSEKDLSCAKDGLERLSLDNRREAPCSQTLFEGNMLQEGRRPLLDYLSKQRNLSKSNYAVGSKGEPAARKISTFDTIVEKQTKSTDADGTRKARAGMLRIIANRLRSKLPTKGELDIFKMAKFMEARVFRSSTTLSEYSDVSTLDARMRVVATVKASRLLMNKSKQGDHRSTALRKMLGISGYVTAQRLIKNIKAEKTALVATRFQCSASPLANSRCGSVTSLSLHKAMPGPVRDLYFHTSELLNVFEKVPVSSLHKVDLALLLEKGSRVYETFLAWKHLNP